MPNNRRPFLSGCALVSILICALIGLSAICVAMLDVPARADASAALEQSQSKQIAQVTATQPTICFYVIVKPNNSVNVREDASASARWIKSLSRLHGVFEYDDVKIDEQDRAWLHLRDTGYSVAQYFDPACDLLTATARAIQLTASKTATSTATAAAQSAATPTRLIIIDIKIDGTSRALCALPCDLTIDYSTPTR